MIVFNLICKSCQFEFEGYFDNSKDYEKQQRKNFINCPNCDSSSIRKFLMSPNLSKKSNARKPIKNKKTVINNIKKYKKIIEKNFDYVGSDFTDEAKKMKYGEINERPIYGEASLDQAKELLDEEISVTPLPWTPSKKTN